MQFVVRDGTVHSHEGQYWPLHGMLWLQRSRKFPNYEWYFWNVRKILKLHSMLLNMINKKPQESNYSHHRFLLFAQFIHNTKYSQPFQYENTLKNRLCNFLTHSCELYEIYCLKLAGGLQLLHSITANFKLYIVRFSHNTWYIFIDMICSPVLRFLTSSSPCRFQ